MAALSGFLALDWLLLALLLRLGLSLEGSVAPARHIAGYGSHPRLKGNKLWGAWSAPHNIRCLYSPMVSNRPSLRPKTSGK
ncbi:MAG TPA: hypothetical protein PLH19_02155 [Anaerolineae bacterium]|nr:hypothetical protein [Anaerolineae bacterium]HQH37326.1 hypothetical protein [Anaerolineae bacterium]